MPITIVTYGGGTNSVAVLLMMLAKREPPPHAILFADTGGEKPHTYDYRDRFSRFIQSYGYPPITTLFRSRRDKRWESLEDQCLRLGVLPAVAYGWKTCSQKFKIEPQDRWANNDPVCKQEWREGRKITKIVGFDAGEVQRASFGEDKKYKRRYPLIDWNINRAGCETIITRVGLPLPGKSACFFCPHAKKREILDMAKTYPDLVQRALRLEQNGMQKTTKAKGLGRGFAWRDLLADHDFAVQEDPYDEIPCGCYDG